MPSKVARVATLELASELRVALMRLTRRLRVERPDEGMTLTQRSVLGTLDEHGPMNLAQLAGHERVQPPSMTRTTAALEERGLITRSTDPKDRRHTVFDLSAEGRRLLHHDRRQREAWLAGQLDRLTAEERALLHDLAPLLNRLAQS
ncbi:MAG: MarR family winged helix-turn-helix transcriptional regulator [Acidothermaceae bacterium]